MSDLIQRLKAVMPNEPDEEIAKDIDTIKKANPSITDEEIFQKASGALSGGGAAPAAPAAPDPRAQVAASLKSKYSDASDSWISGDGTKGPNAPAAPAPAQPKTPETTPEITVDEPRTGRDAAIAALQGLSGFGDAIARSYGGQNTDYLGKSMSVDKESREGRLLRQKAIADQLKDKRSEGREREKVDLQRQELALKEQMEREKLDVERQKIAAQLQEVQARLAALQEDRTFKREEKADKTREKMELLNIPGYELQEGFRPTEKDASDAKKAVATLQDFEAGMGRLKELIGQHGAAEFTGADSEEMRALSSGLKLKLKELQNLGVLSATDSAFLEAQIVNPESWRALFTRDASAQRQLDTTLKSIRGTTDKQLNVLGYKSQGAPQASGGLSPEKKARLEELRRKRAEGTLQ